MATGPELVREAIQKDVAGDIPGALQLYFEALEVMATELKNTKNAGAQAALRSRMREYLNRADELKAVLAEEIQTEEPQAEVAESEEVQPTSTSGVKARTHSGKRASAQGSQGETTSSSRPRSRESVGMRGAAAPGRGARGDRGQSSNDRQPLPPVKPRSAGRGRPAVAGPSSGGRGGASASRNGNYNHGEDSRLPAGGGLAAAKANKAQRGVGGDGVRSSRDVSMRAKPGRGADAGRGGGGGRGGGIRGSGGGARGANAVVPAAPSPAPVDSAEFDDSPGMTFNMALYELQDVLGNYVNGVMTKSFGANWLETHFDGANTNDGTSPEGAISLESVDAIALLGIMMRYSDSAFSGLSDFDKALAMEIWHWRDEAAVKGIDSARDAYRAADCAERLILSVAVSAGGELLDAAAGNLVRVRELMTMLLPELTVELDVDAE